MNPFTITAFGTPIKVREASLKYALGSWNETTGEILIEKDQPEIGKYVVLIHELLHLAETMCLQAGIIKRRVSHKFIGSAPVILFMSLVEAGFWSGTDPAAALKFVEEHVPPIEQS